MCDKCSRNYCANCNRKDDVKMNIEKAADKLPATEYDTHFDQLRKNRVAVSFYKYGTAKKNFGDHLVNALETMRMCIDKYAETGNTEYLCDAANYIMFEYMYPSHKNAHFRATSSEESAGICGFTIKDIEREVAE